MADANVNADANNADAEEDSDNEDELELLEDRLQRLKEEAFTAALERCDITFEPTLIYIQETQKHRTIDDFASLDVDELKAMVSVANKTPHGARAQRGPYHVITAISLKRLTAFREWIKWRQAMNLAVDASEFTVDQMNWALSRKDFETREEKADDAETSKPDPLKTISYKAWIPFWRQFQNYCRTVRGTLNLPIVYVYRDQIEPAPDMTSEEYEDSDEALIACVALTGTYFKEDNIRVWKLIQELTCNGNAWAFVKPFEKTRNGRGAILALKAQCEGAASYATRKKTAYNIISTQMFDGKGRFTWDNYVEKLQYAFGELSDCGDPQSESHKVHILTTHCQCAAMNLGVNTVVNDPDRFGTFLTASESLKGCYEREVSSKVGDRRNVSFTSTSGTGTSDNYKDLKDRYTQAEWSKLSQSTRDRVKQRNRDRKNNSTSPPKESSSAAATTTNKSKNKSVRRIKKLESELQKLKDEQKPGRPKSNESSEDDEDSDATPKTSTKRSKKS